MSTELQPCPFCGGAARIESNRDWHRLFCAHDDDCVLDADDHDLMYPAQPGYLKEIAEVWNRRASPAAAVPEGALPPEKLLQIIAANTGKRISLSLEDLDLYMAVARAAVEADRAQRPQARGDDVVELGMWARWKARALEAEAALADRAQQGEPVEFERRCLRPICSGSCEGCYTSPRITHPDDGALEVFVKALKAKMAKSRAKGRSGWNDPAQCPTERLQTMLLDHLAKGDPLDIANFCMMLWMRGAPVIATKAAAPADASSQQQEKVVRVAPAPAGQHDADELVALGAKMAAWLFGLSKSGLPYESWAEKCAEYSAAWDSVVATSCAQRTTIDKLNSAAPVSSTATAGAVEKSCWSCKRPYTAEQRLGADGNCPHCGVEIEDDSAPQPPEAKAGEPCAHCKRLPGDPDYCDWAECPGGAAPAHPGEQKGSAG